MKFTTFIVSGKLNWVFESVDVCMNERKPEISRSGDKNNFQDWQVNLVDFYHIISYHIISYLTTTTIIIIIISFISNQERLITIKLARR